MKKNIKLLLFGLIAVFVVGLSESVFVIQESHQGILVQLGEVVSEKPILPGLHFKLPFVQKVVEIDRRILNLNSQSREIIAADQKRLIVNYYVKYRITDPINFYKSVRNEMTLANRLGPIVESQVREKVGFVSLISLLKKSRSVIVNDTTKSANQKVKGLGIEVLDVRIKKTDLPEENSEAIYRRMQTEREKEAKEIRAQGAEEAEMIIALANKESKIILAEAYKKAKILEGEGDGIAAKIFNETFSMDKEFFDFYRHMQAYRKSFAEGNTKLIINSDNSFLNHFNDIKVK